MKNKTGLFILDRQVSAQEATFVGGVKYIIILKTLGWILAVDRYN